MRRRREDDEKNKISKLVREKKKSKGLRQGEKKLTTVMT